MPNRPGNDDRNAVTGQRDTSNENARQNGSQIRRKRCCADAKQSRIRLDGSRKTERNRQQGRTGRPRQGHRARIRFRRSTRGRAKGRRGRESQSRAHGGHRTSRRRSSRAVPRTGRRAGKHRFRQQPRGQLPELAQQRRALTVRSRSTARTKASTRTRRATAVGTTRSAASGGRTARQTPTRRTAARASGITRADGGTSC